MRTKSHLPKEKHFDPSHAHGHRKLHPPQKIDDNVESPEGRNSAINRASESDLIFRNENTQRRLIPGASIEKKGRRS